MFAAQDSAEIGDYLGVDNRYHDSDFAAIAAGAVPFA
jgi:hypothetical protein